MRTFILILLSAFVLSEAFAESKWSIDKAYTSIPDTPLSGTIFGREFILGSAELNGHALLLKSKDKQGMWPIAELYIFIDLKDNKKEWIVTPDIDGNVPHIHMKFAKRDKTFPGTLMFTGEYSMRLVFIEVTENKAIGRIHVSLPDYKKSYLIGSFTANIE